jgi:hypothetical protein
VEAWSFGLTVLGWQENLQEEEMPPRWMWHDSKALNEHFRELRRKWKSDGDTEAPEGSLADAANGQDVTLRNAYAKQMVAGASRSSDPFYD